MEPQPEPLPTGRALAWRIHCNSTLTVTLAVSDRWLLMLSDAHDRVNEQWRMGIYMNAEEAQARAVDMTAGYERLRGGKVEEYAQLDFPASAWKQTVDSATVHSSVIASIEEALSTAVSPIDG